MDRWSKQHLLEVEMTARKRRAVVRTTTKDGVFMMAVAAELTIITLLERVGATSSSNLPILK